MNGNWIDKINNLETNPPENGWDKVSVALDESLNGYAFPSKLYDTEVTPPAHLWNQITKELDGEVTPVISLPKRNVVPLILRYAVAACVIGLIAFGTVRFFGNSSGNQVAASEADTINTAATNETAIIPDAPRAEEEITEQQTQAQKDDEALEQSKQTFAKLDLTKRATPSKLYKSPAQLASYTAETNTKKPEIQYSHRAAVNDSPVEESDRYAMYHDANGRSIRISKKLGELFCCVSGEVKDEKCNSQLKEWRQKIAASPFNPSPDNFMDILDLINSIQDNGKADAGK